MSAPECSPIAAFCLAFDEALEKLQAPSAPPRRAPRPRVGKATRADAPADLERDAPGPTAQD